MQWVYLTCGILSEVVATSSLKGATGFTRLWPSVAVVAGYAFAFYFLSLTLKSMPLGVAYAVWCGAGVALVTLVGAAVYHQRLAFGELAGISLIVAGVLVLKLFSQTVVE